MGALFKLSDRVQRDVALRRAAMGWPIDEQLVAPADMKTPAPSPTLRPGEAPHVPLPRFNLRERRVIQPPHWIVPDWIPVERVTLLYAKGGAGKTTLAHQLLAACEFGKPWLGLPVAQCPSSAIFAEDSIDEIAYRQHRISASLGIGADDLTGSSWLAGIGEDNLLMTFDRNRKGVTTRRFAELREDALDRKARLVVIDGAASVFGGNEISRSEVTQFVGVALTKLAMEIGGSVTLLAHQSVAGMQSGGTGGSGSTAWPNSARSMLTLRDPSVDEGGGANERIMTRHKANFAEIGAKLRMEWTASVFLPRPTFGGAFAAAMEPGAPSPSAEDAFVALLQRWRDTGQRLSGATSSGNYAPKIFAGLPEAFGYGRKHLAVAMRSLLVSGRVPEVAYGPASRGTRELVVVPMPEGDE